MSGDLRETLAAALAAHQPDDDGYCPCGPDVTGGADHQADAVIAVLGQPTTWTERNEGLSDGHSESYRAGWRMGRAVRDE